MKISTKVECGIIAMIDICKNSANKNVVNIVNISQRQNISAKYLEQILPLLRHASIVRSVKGARGGYVLSRPAKQITLLEIINALDSSVLSNVSFEDKLDPAVTDAISECLWDKMTNSIRQLAENVTLDELSERYGVISEENSSELMYYI